MQYPGGMHIIRSQLDDEEQNGAKKCISHVALSGSEIRNTDPQSLLKLEGDEDKRPLISNLVLLETASKGKMEVNDNNNKIKSSPTTSTSSVTISTVPATSSTAPPPTTTTTSLSSLPQLHQLPPPPQQLQQQQLPQLPPSAAAPSSSSSFPPIYPSHMILPQQLPQQSTQMPHMLPPLYYGYYPDYYHYYNQFSSYYLQLPPIALSSMGGATQADMIHLYNSYLYQNYSQLPRSGITQQQQQQQQQLLQEQQYRQHQHQQPQQQQQQQQQLSILAQQGPMQQQLVSSLPLNNTTLQQAEQRSKLVKPELQIKQELKSEEKNLNSLFIITSKSDFKENVKEEQDPKGDQDDLPKTKEEKKEMNFKKRQSTVVPKSLTPPLGKRLKSLRGDDNNNHEEQEIKPNTEINPSPSPDTGIGEEHSKNVNHGLSTSRPFPCTEDSCRWSFARLSDLKRHMKSHQPPQFQCPYWRNDPTCHRNGGAFNRLDVLKRHLKLVHYVQDRLLYPPNSKVEQGWCRSCQNQFNNVKDFFDHVNACSLKANPTEWKQHYDDVVASPPGNPTTAVQ